MVRKNIFNSSWVYLGLLVALTIPLCAYLFGPGLIDGHDSSAALIRAMSMEKYMGHGQFLVRWAPEINWGYGYPMFNFYPPFFSFACVLFYQFTHDMVLAINLVCSLFWILSGVGMFLLAREFWGDEGGMLSALLYVYAPYHIIDIYVRGAFAEFTSFAFFPFLLLAILKISRKEGLGALLLGIGSVWGLSLAHNIMSMLFFPVAFVFMLYLFITGKKSTWILTALGMFVLGLMMSSFFWLPALFEKKFLNLNFLIAMRYDFHKSFISLGELFWPWNKGILDNVSYQVGVIYSLLCLMSLVGVLKIFKKSKEAGLGLIFFFTVGALAVLFTLPYSHFIWEHINMLSFVQFPWRFLAIIVFAMSFLCGSAVMLIQNPKARMIFLVIVSLLAIFISLKYSIKPKFISHERKIEDFIAMGEGEYTPRWIMVPPGSRPSSKFEIVHGNGILGEEKSINPVQYDTQIQAMGPCFVFFRTFYFPGWQVFIDGQKTNPYLDNPFGIILFAVPPGAHHLQVVFGQTPVRIAGMVISWAGLVFLLAWVLLFKRKIS